MGKTTWVDLAVELPRPRWLTLLLGIAIVMVALYWPGPLIRAAGWYIHEKTKELEHSWQHQDGPTTGNAIGNRRATPIHPA